MVAALAVPGNQTDVQSLVAAAAAGASFPASLALERQRQHKWLASLFQKFCPTFASQVCKCSLSCPSCHLDACACESSGAPTSC